MTVDKMAHLLNVKNLNDIMKTNSYLTEEC